MNIRNDEEIRKKKKSHLFLHHDLQNHMKSSGWVWISNAQLETKCSRRPPQYMTVGRSKHTFVKFLRNSVENISNAVSIGAMQNK